MWKAIKEVTHASITTVQDLSRACRYLSTGVVGTDRSAEPVCSVEPVDGIKKGVL